MQVDKTYNEQLETVAHSLTVTRAYVESVMMGKDETIFTDLLNQKLAIIIREIEQEQEGEEEAE